MFKSFKYSGPFTFGLGLSMLIGSIFAPPLAPVFLVPGLIFTVGGAVVTVVGVLSDYLDNRTTSSPSSSVQSTPSRPSRNTSENKSTVSSQSGRKVESSPKSVYRTTIPLHGAAPSPTAPIPIMPNQVWQLNRKLGN